MDKTELINYLDNYLKISDIQDSSKNGLQVDSEKSDIKKIGYGVDATTYTFDLAIKEQVDMIIVHHGLFWGIENTITNLYYDRLSKLIKNDISLYASHLPLDLHIEVGNNIGLINGIIDTFDLKKYDIKPFGDYHGETIGYGIDFYDSIQLDEFVNKYCKSIKIKKDIYNFSKKKYISSVAVVSGGGADVIAEASISGYDLFITGESPHHRLCQAKELGLSVLLGGHRETEVFGVRLLSEHLRDKFGIEIVFLDEGV